MVTLGLQFQVLNQPTHMHKQKCSAYAKEGLHAAVVRAEHSALKYRFSGDFLTFNPLILNSLR